MGPILVVEDELAVRRTIVRFVRQHRPVREAATSEEAIRLIGTHDDWAGFLFDVALGEDRRAGVHLLGAARRIFPSIPAALLTASRETEVINQAALLSASFMAKPFGIKELLAFLRRVMTVEAEVSEELDGRLQQLARQWDLTPAELGVLAWHITDRPREAWIVLMDGTPHAWNRHVEVILEKARTNKMQDVVTTILTDHIRARRRRTRHER